eukprot:11083961-Alexandrium_andersonii.AAC.1
MCRFGKVHLRSRLPILKPTWFMSTSPEIIQELGRRCQGGHEHGQVLGGADITRDAGVYSVQLARAVLRGLRRTLQRKEPERLRRLAAALDARIREKQLRAPAQMVDLAQSLRDNHGVYTEFGRYGCKDGITFDFSANTTGRKPN